MSFQTEKSFLIGLDLGTSAIKGALADQNGNFLAQLEKKTSFIYPNESWLEFNPEEHYRNVCEVIRSLAVEASGNVAALAMSAASGNSLLCDKQGNPLTNIISWMDRRSAGMQYGFNSEDLRNVTGWPCHDSFPLAHFSWWKENCPELYKKTGHYCMNTDWLAFKMTGKWRMDHSTATTFHLQDQVNRIYHKPYLEKLDIPEEKLSKLMPSGKVIGNLTRQAALDTGLSENTVLVSGSFDHPSAARATEILKPGQLLLSCGTSWVGFLPEMDRKKILDAELLCDPFLSGSGDPWGAMFSIPHIGRAIDWHIENIIAPDETDKYQVFNKLASKAEPDAGGLKIDLRQTPQKIVADRKNISRAIMKNAAELLAEKIKGLETYGFKFEGATMVGGPSKSPIWPRIIAEKTGLELSLGCQFAGAKGAAMLAGTGIGIYQDKYNILN